jgi:hypothetical protein
MAAATSCLLAIPLDLFLIISIWQVNVSSRLKGRVRRLSDNQRSHFVANPTRFNPGETPNNRNEKLLFPIFNNLGLGKTTDQAV